MDDPNDGRWKNDDTPPEIVASFLENLVAVDGTRLNDLEWASENDVNPRSLRRWKKDPRFRKLWALRADESVLGPDAIAPIYQAALKIASDADHPQWGVASKMILGLAEKIRPPQIQVQVSATDRFTGMSDAELAAWAAPDVINVTQVHELNAAVDAD